ncbi:MAG: hypothetical protein KKD18_01745 [Nanoarchaeota archaeon]|nr:hypothetical protein [Nanoarchaeota archaeon]MBU0977117.1 hypothetical protein [Nanoarchaeota archaeon]
MNLKKGVKKQMKNILAIALFFGLFASLLSTTIATQSGTNGDASLKIWDDTDPEGGSIIRLSTTNITFVANFTNSTNDPINTTGNCTIKFDYTGSYGPIFNMTFNTSVPRWIYTTLIQYKGTHNFQVNCSSIYGNISLEDSFVITNKIPVISKDAGGSFIDLDGNQYNTDYLQCEEDTLCIYNFSANVTEYDLNDVLTFENGTNTTLTNYQLNTVSGILQINYTTDEEIGNGNKQIELKVKDTESLFQPGILRVNITPENDPPYFLNLGSERIINKSGIDLILAATDEENDTPYIFNITFQNCVHTSLNPPTGPDNCTLFNLTDYNASATNISFIPNGQQKGEYEINFSVKDARNGTYSEVVNWTVSWNDAPFFTYVCNNERTATEDTPFTCFVNASDPDEAHNLTFIVNYTWLKFNETDTNYTTISTGSTGNASALLNFTPTDSEVGNWSINLTVIDTGAPNASIELNSTTFFLFVENINDSVQIQDIPDMTAYTSAATYQVLVNATDDDLLVPDKTIKNETLTFFTNNSLVSVASTTYITGTNRTEATLSFDPLVLGVGDHIINVTVQDKGNFSTSSDLFTITVIDNNAPVWNESTSTNLTFTEGQDLYLNLSQNVTDSDDINFTITDITGYGSCDFGIESAYNADTGIVNFTLADKDVGLWKIRVTATDGKTPRSLDFNITVNNVNDPPQFYQVAAYYNMSYSNGMINLTEDNYTKIYLQITDEDLKICSYQSGFYSESFTYDLNITGPNPALFSFETEEQVGISPPRYQYVSYRFAPQKSDVGLYNVTFNVTDLAGNSSFSQFNLTVLETLHPPNITDIANAELSILSEIFYTDANSSDIEDGQDAWNGSLTFRIQNLTVGGNFLTVNASTGVINFTTNSSHAGKWQFKLIVNDTDGAEASDYFNLSIYDYPVILLPAPSYLFSLKENTTSALNFTANHTVQNSLNYTLIINGVTKNQTSGYGNATEFILNYAPNFTMETTCSGPVNLTLNVSNAKLSNSTTWSVEINHTDCPLVFFPPIDPIGPTGSPYPLYLTNHFQDCDASDGCRNQTIGFVYTLVNGSTSGGAITVTLANWSGNGSSPRATFSSTTDGSANYSLRAIEYNLSNPSQAINSIDSNNFSVSLTVTEAQTTITQSSGGGGGSSRIQIVSLKIIVPEPVSAKQNDKLIIPLGLENDGTVNLRRILLSATIAKDGELRNDLVATFSQSFFEELNAGEKENTTLIVDIDTISTGLFEVTINATVEEPVYSDWAKFYIEIESDLDVLERIIFTKEFIYGNPVCRELQEMLEEATALVETDPARALEIAEQVTDLCQELITQPPRPRIAQVLSSNIFIGYTAIASLLAFAAGFIYYTYKKGSMKRKLQRDLGNI